MDTMSWQEITVRLLFAFMLGGATAIEKKWYQTQKSLKFNTQIALGAAMFAILTSLTTQTKFSAQLVLGISIICSSGIFFPKPINPQRVNLATKLWCAGAVGSLVGYGLFASAYAGTIASIAANILLPTTDTVFVPKIEKELIKAKADDPKQLETITTEQPVSTIPQEICYRCQVRCLVANEVEVLALLVQLGKEQKLTPTAISSQDSASSNVLPEIEIEVDFVTDSSNSLQLQQVLIKLKSDFPVSSARWICLSPELASNNPEALPSPKKAHRANQKLS